MTRRITPTLLILVFVLLGCDEGTTMDTSSVSYLQSEATILSSYYGLDELPPPIVILCQGLSSVGEDGMPVTFSEQIDAESLTPEMFAVQTADSSWAVPTCATLRPADEPLELRTVLLTGPFGTANAQPQGVEVVGDLLDVEGKTLKGLRSGITPLEAGPSVLLAELFDPQTEGLRGECPDQTTQVVQLTWEGGVTGPDGSALAEPQRQAVTVLLENGENVTPIALADDDPDNFVHACLQVDSPAVSVTIAAGYFHDPGDDANPATSAILVPGNE
jgi:FAD/FMN-containing dehydrogenase